MAANPVEAAHPHPTSPRTYYLVFAALILLTASTALAAVAPLKDWGLEAWHTPIGMAIAAAKAALIVLFFMHGLESGKLVWMVIAVALLFLAILYGLTFADYGTRRLDEGVRDPGPRSSLTVPALGGHKRGVVSGQGA